MSSRFEMTFSGKVAIVTGAAQGIGESVAHKLASAGASVLIVDYNIVGAEEVASKIVDEDGEAACARADVTKPEEIEAFVQQAVDAWGRVDILVNNASNVASIGADDGDVVSTSMETWDAVYACNLRGPAAACKFSIPHMIAGGGGAIVNIASVQGVAGDVSRCAYGANKAGLIMLSKYIATSFGRQGVRCNSVSPGLVMSKSAHESPQEYLDLVLQHMPLNFKGQPADLAEVICFLASDAARYVTGQNIVVDGGLTSHQPMYADVVTPTTPRPERPLGSAPARWKVMSSEPEA